MFAKYFKFWRVCPKDLTPDEIVLIGGEIDLASSSTGGNYHAFPPSIKRKKLEFGGWDYPMLLEIL